MLTTADLLYGTMGGDAQPQAQAAVFTRVATFGMDPQAAVSAPRWVFGRTWGQQSSTLKLESRFGSEVFAELASRGTDRAAAGLQRSRGTRGRDHFRPDGVMEGGADRARTAA